MKAEAKELEQRCKKTAEHFKIDLAKVRTGRASAGLIEDIRADYYGSMTPIKQLGNITAPEPRSLYVTVYDAAAVEPIDKAIRQADLGLNPARDGNALRILVPALTEDRRKVLQKKVDEMTEEVRVSIRNQRRDSIEKVKKAEKDKVIGQDESRKIQEEVQKVVDKVIVDVEAMAAAKKKEIMEV
jgi:ribosome recycling factor